MYSFSGANLYQEEPKLIACDIDGTLLHNGARKIDDKIFQEFQRLIDNGYIVAIASGRQYLNMYELFSPLANKLYFVCENGCLVRDKFPVSEKNHYNKKDFISSDNSHREFLQKLSYLQSQGIYEEKSAFLKKYLKNAAVLKTFPIDRDLAINICRDIMAESSCELVISGLNQSYLIPHNLEFCNIIKNYWNIVLEYLNKPEEMPENFLKIAAFCSSSSEEIREKLAPKYQDKINVDISGNSWLDFCQANKAVGLAFLCQHLQIKMSQVMAFGDNFNDLKMLQSVGHPYLMANASENLKKELCVKTCERVEHILCNL